MNAGCVRGRCAPSPTGDLHLGNLRTALLAWLAARAVGGTFTLRIEDLDMPRVRPGATASMLAALRWLGLDWDEGPDIGGAHGPYFQSQRHAIYTAAIARLRTRGLVYPCYCSRLELARIASAPHDAHDTHDAPVYPGTCRALTPQQRVQREAEGRRPALRFRVPTAPVEFVDALAGPQRSLVAADVGDFIVRRSDGIVAYQLAVVVDDALMGVTQVVRGADLLGSTARQLALYDALGYPRPHHYLNVPLVTDKRGARLAKRESAPGIARLVETGGSPQIVLGALAASCGLWTPGSGATLTGLLACYDERRLTPTPSAVYLEPDDAARAHLGSGQ